MDTTFPKSHSDGEVSPDQSPKVNIIKRLQRKRSKKVNIIKRLQLKRSKSEVIDSKKKAALLIKLASVDRVKALDQAYKQDPDVNMIIRIRKQKNVLTRSQSEYSRSQDEDPFVAKVSKQNMISQLIVVPNDEK